MRRVLELWTERLPQSDPPALRPSPLSFSPHAPPPRLHRRPRRRRRRPRAAELPSPPSTRTTPAESRLVSTPSSPCYRPARARPPSTTRLPLLLLCFLFFHSYSVLFPCFPMATTARQSKPPRKGPDPAARSVSLLSVPTSTSASVSLPRCIIADSDCITSFYEQSSACLGLASVAQFFSWPRQRTPSQWQPAARWRFSPSHQRSPSLGRQPPCPDPAADLGSDGTSALLVQPVCCVMCRNSMFA